MTAPWQEFNAIDTRDYEARHPALFAYVKDAMTAPGKQYLLIGDTDHFNPALHKFMGSPALAALFNHAAIPHVCVELPREIVSPARLAVYQEQRKTEPKKAEKAFWQDYEASWQDTAASFPVLEFSPALHRLRKTGQRITGLIEQDRITPAEGLSKWNRRKAGAIRQRRARYGSRLLGFTHAGLRVTNADSWQWYPFLVPGLAERVFLGDREVAAHIRNQARDEKTAVIYGALHFWYESALGSRLGREKSVQIDIHTNRAAYEQGLKTRTVHADILPDRVYLLEEAVLEKPDPALYRAAKNRLDDDAQQWKDDVARRFGAAADPAIKAAAVAGIIRQPGTDAAWFDYVPPAP